MGEVSFNAGHAAGSIDMNKAGEGVLPLGVYREATPDRLTITTSTEAAAVIKMKDGLIVAISDGTHQINYHIRSDEDLPALDLSSNEFVILSYTYDSNVNTKPVASSSATIATGNDVTLCKITRGGGNITGFEYEDSLLIDIQTVAGPNRNIIRKFANLARG